MELTFRDRKKIMNGDESPLEELPHYNDLKLPDTETPDLNKWLHKPDSLAIGGMVTGGVNFLGQAVNSFGRIKPVSDILAESGTSIGQGSGFTYLKQNQVDAGAQMSELSQLNTANTLLTAAAGALMGAAFGPIGAGIGAVVGGSVGFIGGLFRKSKMADRIKKALILAINNNNYALASALSDYLTNDYNAKHDNTQNDLLYHAEEGKSPVDYTMQLSGFIKKNGKWVFDGHAMLSNGEVKFHTDKLGRVTDYERIGKGKDNNDTVKVKLGDTPEEYAHTGVVTNHNGASDYAMATGDMYGGIEIGLLNDMEKGDRTTILLIANQVFDKKNGILMARGGKLPKYEYQKPPIGSQKWWSNETLDYTQPYRDWADSSLENNGILNIPARKRLESAESFLKLPEGGSLLGKLTTPDLNINLRKELKDPEKKPAKGVWQSGVDNAIATLFGLATAYGLLPKGPLSQPDTNTSNQHERYVLDTLWGMRANGAQRILAAKDTYANAFYNINRMGGLSGAQKYLSAVLSNIGLLKNIASIIADINRENNGYKTQAANMAAQLGGQGAERAQRALIHDYDAYSRAHGAAIQQANMSSLNALEQILQYLKNARRLKEFERTMAYYDLDYQLRKDALKRGWFV